ncbi:MAG: DUF2189 domain-containing protein [Burkholderiaceae bacterium]
MIAVHENLSATASLLWLKQGWNDLLCSGMRGCFYGAVFALMGYAIAFIYGTFWQATMGLTAGFFLVGPFLCCGIYELSRQRARGEPFSLPASLTSFMRNWKSIAFLAAMLTFFMVVWARVSVVIFALFASHDYPTLQAMFGQIVSAENIEFLLVWGGVGFVIASLVFSISVVSMPLLLDRDTDTLEAVFASARALWANPITCLVWGGLIVAIIGASLLIFLPLLIVTAPWVGHATWHAYKGMIGAHQENLSPSLA